MFETQDESMLETFLTILVYQDSTAGVEITVFFSELSSESCILSIAILEEEIKPVITVKGEF